MTLDSYFELSVRFFLFASLGLKKKKHPKTQEQKPNLNILFFSTFSNIFLKTKHKTKQNVVLNQGRHPKTQEQKPTQKSKSKNPT